MKLPKKISPCPILDANVEIRFDALLPPEAIFGILFEKFKADYKDFEKLPILQLPDEIRSNDPNLIFQPHYKLKKDGFAIQLGPKMLSIGSVGEYKGWNIYFQEIKSVLSKTKKTKIFGKINRLGVRYINFFDFNIFEKVKLEVSLDGDKLTDGQSLFRTAVKAGQFANNLQIANNATVNKHNKIVTGSVLDIDVTIEKSGSYIYTNLSKLIENAHKEEKKLFYNLLREEFLATLQPEY